VVENQKEQQLKDVRELISAGRIEEEHFIEGYKVKLRTLTGDEVTEAFTAAQMLTGASNLALAQAIKVEVVARSLASVNGVPPESLYEGPEDNLTKNLERDKVIKKRWLAGSLQQKFINKLYDIYLSMDSRKEKAGDGLGE